MKLDPLYQNPTQNSLKLNAYVGADINLLEETTTQLCGAGLGTDPFLEVALQAKAGKAK